MSPHMSKESSVTVANRTPVMMGIRDKYTWNRTERSSLHLPGMAISTELTRTSDLGRNGKRRTEKQSEGSTFLVLHYEEVK